MLMYQKTMFDRYYCIKSFCHLKTLEKRFEKFILYYYNVTQSMKDSYVLKSMFQSKDLHHPNITELRSFLDTLLLMTSIFVTA